MGYRVSWLARSGVSVQELLDAFGRQLTGIRVAFPDVGWYLLELNSPHGIPWVVLIANGTDNFAELNDSDARRVSRDGQDVLYFSCSDTVMATQFVCFKSGSETWAVDYDSSDNKKQPSITGNPPSIVYELLSELRAKQQTDNVADHIYDLTAELGRTLVGFRHDTDLELDDPTPFQVLRNLTKQPWWQFWK